MDVVHIVLEIMRLVCHLSKEGSISEGETSLNLMPCVGSRVLTFGFEVDFFDFLPKNR